MKTNHQRNFKATNDSGKFKTQSVLGGNLVNSKLADRIISAGAHVWDTQFISAKKRARKNVAGAKKYVSTRTRFHENAATFKLAKEIDHGF